MSKKFPSIMGLNRTSEAGFNLFAVSIFLFGCNFRCPYCMNGRLVVEKPEDFNRPVKTIDIENVKKAVEEEDAKWVMISGGEPTLTPIEKLQNLISEIKSWGCNIGISTNGTYPAVLKEILPLVNYVAMDLKSTDPMYYEQLDIKHKEKAFYLMLESKGLLVMNKLERNDFDYEIRTTMYPSYVKMEDIYKIGGIIRENETWVFQQFRHAKDMLLPDEAKSVRPYSDSEIELIIKEAKKYTKNVHIRYV